MSFYRLQTSFHKGGYNTKELHLCITRNRRYCRYLVVVIRHQLRESFTWNQKCFMLERFNIPFHKAFPTPIAIKLYRNLLKVLKAFPDFARSQTWAGKMDPVQNQQSLLWRMSGITNWNSIAHNQFPHNKDNTLSYSMNKGGESGSWWLFDQYTCKHLD